MGAGYVAIVVFELDYMVNVGRSEAEGVGMEGKSRDYYAH